MEQKLEELKKHNEEEITEYFESIKESVADKSYFEDAVNWYLFRYVSAVCDRTILIFAAIIGAVALYSLVQIISHAFPLIERVPIIIKDKDQSRYTPFIKKLQNSADNQSNTIDKAIAKYLVSIYVQDRENYDYRKSQVNDVNVKFNRIKNTSSANEYRNFQLLMSKDNPGSPIHNFGINVYREVEIESIKFIETSHENYYFRFKEFFVNKLPNEAEIKFTTTVKKIDNDGIKEEKERYLAKINFNFSGVNRDSKAGILNFMVSGYKLYKIK
jgi:type IV secretory pathway component VirB8